MPGNPCRFTAEFSALSRNDLKGFDSVPILSTSCVGRSAFCRVQARGSKRRPIAPSRRAC